MRGKKVTMSIRQKELKTEVVENRAVIRVMCIKIIAADGLMKVFQIRFAKA